MAQRRYSTPKKNQQKNNLSLPSGSKAESPKPVLIRKIAGSLFEVSKSNIFSLEPLHHDHNEYKSVKKLITNSNIKVEYITKIYNKFLESAYHLKKLQKPKHLNATAKEMLLFHGTKLENVATICKYNFDWRKSGENTGHKFGKGVSFSTNAMYASNYSDEKENSEVMFLAKVLVTKVCNGKSDMAIADVGADTAIKSGNYVVTVKFEDAEFYPAYVLGYHYKPSYVPNKGYRNRRKRAKTNSAQSVQYEDVDNSDDEAKEEEDDGEIEEEESEESDDEDEDEDMEEESVDEAMEVEDEYDESDEEEEDCSDNDNSYDDYSEDYSSEDD